MSARFAGPADRPGRIHDAWLLVVAVFVLVVLSDQATKWVAWRHLSGTVLNDGGYILLGSARSWFAEPVPGAVANVVGIGLVAAGLVVLLRRPRRTAVTVGGGMVAAGWTSNLLDRLGLHEWSAPGSARGVVDFVPSGGTSRCNVADFWIATGLIVLGVAMLRRRRASMPRHPWPERLSRGGSVLPMLHTVRRPRHRRRPDRWHAVTR